MPVARTDLRWSHAPGRRHALQPLAETVHTDVHVSSAGGVIVVVLGAVVVVVGAVVVVVGAVVDGVVVVVVGVAVVVVVVG
jgi:hypothetical protein